MAAAAAWYEKGESLVFRIFGAAGTGKTTLANELVERIGVVGQFCAFTGKAALRLRQKGCANASTIHSLIYTPKEKSEERLRMLQDAVRKMKARQTNDPASWTAADDKALAHAIRSVDKEEENLHRPSFKLNLDSDLQLTKLAVLDEMSMIDSQLGGDFLSFKVPTLVLGDPYQLPPVGDSKPFFGGTPEVMLKEIHRQALDSEILSLATEVRQGLMPRYWEGKDLRIIRKGNLKPEDLLAFDQILVGKNVTRKRVNDDVRFTALGRTGPLPAPGDKLVCRRNDADASLMNGGLWECVECREIGSQALSLTIADEQERTITVTAHKAPFVGEKISPWERLDRQHFEFGFALTVHQAQGSEWPNVLVIDESYCFRNDRSKWLYTAVTRASERLTLVR